MKRFLAGFAASALFSVVTVQALRAQVLITGENGGKGSRAIMITANAIQPKDFGTLANVWAQYGYGATDRVDAFLELRQHYGFWKIAKLRCDWL